MMMRAIMAAASGGAATAGTIDLGCQLARRFDAHLEVFHVLPDARAVFASGSEIAAPGSAAFAASVLEEAAAKAEETRAVFDDVVTRHGIALGSVPMLGTAGPSASWRQEIGAAPALVARRGRFFDLLVLGRSERVVREPHTDTIEETLTRSGRPLLLAPAPAPSGIGQVVAVAWNGSPEAVRAIAAGLPFLEKANAVCLITAGDNDAHGSGSLIDYLGWHGLNVEHRRLKPSSSRQIGRVLLDAAADFGADLLIMGAYGHAPWRESLFGGATRAALTAAALPVLLMH